MEKRQSHQIVTREASAKLGNQSIESNTTENFKKHAITEYKSMWKTKGEEKRLNMQ